MQLGSSIKRRRGARSGGPKGGGAAKTWLANRRTRRIALWALGLTFGGFGLGWVVATQLIFPAPPPPGDMYAVPDLYGASLAEANRRIEQAGLKVGGIQSVGLADADSGQVVGQAPLPGQLALPGAEVLITVSGGAERRQIPSVVDMNADRAQAALQDLGFTVRVDSTESDQPRGVVVSMDPAAGNRLPIGGSIRLLTSVGPPAVPMPNLVGMDEAQARDTINALGLLLLSIEDVDRGASEVGKVISQEPSPDTPIDRGAAVKLRVGRRPRR